MSEPGPIRTVGFFDLSARMRSGPEGLSRSAIQQRLEVLAEEVSAVGGRIIKQISDELMCTFEEPTDAVDLAIIMQAALDDLVSDGLHSHLRIGLHCGPVVDEHDDVFGDTVNIAARMTSIAGPGQVIASEDIVSRLPEEQRDSTRLFDRVKVKGSRRERAIYRILWSPRSETLGEIPVPNRTDLSRRALVVTCSDFELRIEPGGEDARLGRDRRCEMVVRSEMASRFHAMIGPRRGKFVLKDQSTNGTYVSMQGSPVFVLKREELPLFGEGVISLGEAVREDGEHLIRFAFD